MTIFTRAAEQGGTTAVYAASTQAVHPSRESATGVCMVCLRRCGGAAECIAYFERALWQICPLCDGMGWIDSMDPTPCMCWSGVIEATPASLAAAEAAAAAER